MFQFALHRNDGNTFKGAIQKWTAGQREKIVETISKPDLIQAGDFGELLAIKLYPTTPLTRKHLVVAYKEVANQDGFVLTAYFTASPPKWRQIIWKH